MSIPVPHLSSKGWITDMTNKLDVLLSHFIVAEHSQSHIYFSNITSLPYLVATYGHNPDTMRDMTQSALERYLNRYFQAVEVEVTTRDIIESGEATNRYELRLLITSYDNGQRYNMAQEFEIIEGTFKRLAEVANG